MLKKIKNQRLINFILTFTIIVGLLSAISRFITVSADNTATPAFKYTIINGEVTITKYTGNDTNVDIPASIDGYPVKVIGNQTFMDCTNLTSVKIPDGVIVAA